MIARCIENKADNPCYTVGKAYEINDEGLSNDYSKKGVITDTWNGQFSSGPKPILKEGTRFKRNGVWFKIESGTVTAGEEGTE